MGIIPYVPYLLQQKALTHLSATDYSEIVGNKTNPIGFIPDCFEYSICVDYLSLTVKWEDFGVGRHRLSQIISNREAISYRQKILNYVIHFLDDFYRQERIPLDWLLKDELPASASGWKPHTGKRFYKNSIQSPYGVVINYSGDGQINSDTINLVFSGEALRRLRFSYQLELMYKLSLMNFRARRIDTAYDVFSEVSVGNFIEVAEKGDVFGIQAGKNSYYKTCGTYAGSTLEFGSRSSQKFARIYDAGFKHCKDLIDRLPFNWTRIECEFKDEKAVEVFNWITKIYASSGRFQAMYAQKLAGSHLQFDADKGDFELLVFDGWQIDEKVWHSYFSLWRSLILSVFDLRKDKKGGNGKRERCQRYEFFDKIVDSEVRFQFTEGDNLSGNAHPVSRAVKWIRKQVAGSLSGLLAHCAEFNIDFTELIEVICYQWMGKQPDKKLERHLTNFCQPDSIMYNPLGLDFLLGESRAGVVSGGAGYEIALGN